MAILERHTPGLVKRGFSATRLYMFGFSGKEKDDEVYNSTGTSYTAMFWQYDSRTGRRWNLDPKPNPSISSYATFANNPIWFADNVGSDTLMMHRKSLGTENNVEIFLVTFSIIKDGIEERLSDVMYMGINSNYVRVPDNKTVKLSYDRIMQDHSEWKNISIHIEYTYTKKDGSKGNNKFIHPTNFPAGNIGCATLSEKKPYTYYGDMLFEATEPALKKVRKMYISADGENGNLTGEKFLLKTESVAKSTPIKKMKPLKAKKIENIVSQEIQQE